LPFEFPAEIADFVATAGASGAWQFSAVEAATLKQLIVDGIPSAQVEVVDLHGTGDHFEVSVVAESFEGKSMVERHRMVYAALGDAMRSEIHALMIEALSPAQYRGGLLNPVTRS